ncbi:HEPN domain-containing protein [Paenibacillus sp. P96]|uniref:HEPN domain-containing protein n=1 Tax=Paenibacillus zeirhizosphaerae TaxID=2987519 RepID=A0ABT9FSF3_9BACL|nr:HEPN domain-containing protein [Paenibacillus sp. P96]MDP4097451.1 HEPN domain-containing protein [Paenibacillus sp. P96]
MSFKGDAVKSFLKRAKGKYSAAVYSFENEDYPAAVASLYYSAFQSVSALMIHRDVPENKHTQVRAWVGRELFKQGLISSDLAKMYNRLMDDRQDADYKPTVNITREVVESYFVPVKEFNSIILKMIQQEGLEDLDAFYIN